MKFQRAGSRTDEQTVYRRSRAGSISTMGRLRTFLGASSSESLPSAPAPGTGPAGAGASARARPSISIPSSSSSNSRSSAAAASASFSRSFCFASSLVALRPRSVSIQTQDNGERDGTDLLKTPLVPLPHAKHLPVLPKRLIAHAESKKWPQSVTTGSLPNGLRQIRHANGRSSSSLSDPPPPPPPSRAACLAMNEPAAAEDDRNELSSCQPCR